MRIGLGSQISATVSEFHDAWFNALRGGTAYAMQFSINPGASNFGKPQLYNAIGSGKTVILWRAILSINGAQNLNGYFTNTQFATDLGQGFNLAAGSGASTTHLRNLSDATQPGNQFLVEVMLANTVLYLDSGPICQLPEGQGVYFTHSTAASIITGTYFWQEI
jgi:hypothetical protein